MDKTKILQGFDQFAKAKRSWVWTMRVIIISSALCVMASLSFAGWSYLQAINKVIVVDNSTGIYLKTTAADEEKLLFVRIKTHCAEVVQYANSFDRLTIMNNQVKTVFRCSKADATRIFAWYQKRRAYGDAMERAVIYTANFQKINALERVDEKWTVAFTSELNAYEDGQLVSRFQIKSQGILIPYTPQFPENPSGLYFTSYSQEWHPINLNDE